MKKDISSKKMTVFSDVITDLVSNAISNVSGISVLTGKSTGRLSSQNRGISASILPNEKVAIDMYVSVDSHASVPTVVAEVQESIKKEVEGATKYKVHSVNVQVVSVIF